MPINQARVMALIDYISALRADQELFIKTAKTLLDQEGLPTAFKVQEIVSLGNALLGKPPREEYLEEKMHFKLVAKRNDSARAYRQRKRQGQDQSHHNKQPAPDQTRAMQSALSKHLGAIADRQMQAQQPKQAPIQEPPKEPSKEPIQPQDQPMTTALPDGVVIRRAPDAWRDVDVDADPFE